MGTSDIEGWETHGRAERRRHRRSADLAKQVKNWAPGRRRAQAGATRLRQWRRDRGLSHTQSKDALYRNRAIAQSPKAHNIKRERARPNEILRPCGVVAFSQAGLSLSLSLALLCLTCGGMRIIVARSPRLMTEAGAAGFSAGRTGESMQSWLKAELKLTTQSISVRLLSRSAAASPAAALARLASWPSSAGSAWVFS